jgi:alpha-1,2-mannosyltransferase
VQRFRQLLGRREAVLVAVALLAIAVRLFPLLRGGGLGFYNGYDDGVYYAAADSLTFGRLPYRDFLLLHPPGIAVLLFPFAALGRVTTDATGMAVARCFFIALGGLNAALVAAIAYRWSRRAAIAGGVLYACWFPAVLTEQSTRLEPVGTTMLLVALLLLLRRESAVSWRSYVLAGGALGFASGVKIWCVVPWLVVVGAQLVARRWRHALYVVAGGAGVLAVLLTPFFAAAPSRMFDMVLRDQFRRPDVRTQLSLRLSSIFGVDSEKSVNHPEVAAIVGVVVLVGLVACLWDRDGRVIAALFGANLAVLLTAPTYFRHYAEFVAPLAVLVVAVGGERLVPAFARAGGRLVAVPAVTAVLLAVASGVAVGLAPEKVAVLPAALTSAAPSGCIKSDDPGVLIQLDRLSSDMRGGCPLAVDVWGTERDQFFTVRPDGRVLGPLRNEAWQNYLVHYLTTGNAFVIAKHKINALSPRTKAILRSYPLIADSHGVVLRE